MYGTKDIQPRVQAVKLVRDRGVAVAQACRDLEIAESVLRRWMRETEADPRAVAKLKAERDILKRGPQPASRRGEGIHATGSSECPKA